jgi:hypothetical protein
LETVLAIKRVRWVRRPPGSHAYPAGYGELYDYDSVSDQITADAAAGIHPGISSTASAIS